MATIMQRNRRLRFFLVDFIFFLTVANVYRSFDGTIGGRVTSIVPYPDQPCSPLQNFVRESFPPIKKGSSSEKVSSTNADGDDEDSKKTERHQIDAVRSLEYWIDGEWLTVDPTKQNNLTVPRNETYRDESNGQDALLDPLYFKPTRIKPIERMTLEQALQEAHQDEADWVAGKLEEVAQEMDEKESSPLLQAVQYRRFRPEQAQQCLKNKRVFMIGDSHMRNLWRGLNDVVAGNLDNDYRRFDGYRAPKSSEEELPRIIPSNYLPGFFPYPGEGLGVPGMCKIRPARKRKLGYPGFIYGDCGRIAKQSSLRLDYDIRRLDCEACESNQISLDFSGCATSFRNILDSDPTGTTDGPGCRTGLGRWTRKAPETRSQWQQLLDEGISSGDIVVMGFHAHDIKAANCDLFQYRNMTNQDIFKCRFEHGLELLQNAEQVAKEAREKGIRLFWMTYTFEDLENIPQEYRAFQRTGDMYRERRALAGIMHNHGHAVLDTFHMSLSARAKYDQVQKDGGQWPDAFEAGSHDGRFLARMKMNILLNSLCPDMGQEDPSSSSSVAVE